ncbi:MAG: hut operon positive regulator HutP [Ruminococcaceae bacterium]|nr:hut operon positive regulator HutP [Oscillospiraceae bacterium]
MGSKEVAAAAIKVAVTQDRNQEKAVQEALIVDGIQAVAVDFGGEFISSITKIIERAIVAARREGLIDESHIDEGAVAGAAKEAVSQIMNKAIGLNVGGKIAVARCGEHISVAVFFGIGLLHLNEVAVGVGHRVL